MLSEPRRPPKRVIKRLMRALKSAKRWRGAIYWKESFKWGACEVLAACIPGNILSRIESNDIAVLEASVLMSYRLFDSDIPHTLCEETILYCLGVREDAKLAAIAGEAAVEAFKNNNFKAALDYAHQAYKIEYEHSKRARFWSQLLYTIYEESEKCQNLITIEKDPLSF